MRNNFKFMTSEEGSVKYGREATQYHRKRKEMLFLFFVLFYNT